MSPLRGINAAHLFRRFPSLHIYSCYINLHINAQAITQEAVRLEVLMSVTYQSQEDYICCIIVCVPLVFLIMWRVKKRAKKKREFGDVIHFENVKGF